jgi:hypothetical protein
MMLTNSWWPALLGIAGGLLLLWLVMLVLLWRAQRRSTDRTSLHEALRLLPDLLRLLRRLAADPTLPRGVRARVLLLLGYLLYRSTWFPTSSPCSVM